MIFEVGKKLYHGSYIAVKKPDLTECKPGKLTDQICLRTEKAMAAIKFAGSEKQTIRL